MDAVATMATLKIVCDTVVSMEKLATALTAYLDYIKASNKITEANDILEQAKDILQQDENDELLKFTRVITHLEYAYWILKTKRDNALFTKTREKIQHKINQVCYALAMLHKKMGNSQSVIMKYAVELTSLGNPVSSNHIPIISPVGTEYVNDIYFVMLDEDLRFLLTEEQYKQFRKVYDAKIAVIAKREREEEERLENRIPLFDDYDPLL